MTVTATFTPSTGTLAANGDTNPNSILFGRDAAGNILVNGGAIAIAGGMPTVATTSLLTATGLAGADVIALDESNGALPRADLFGGTGNDTLTGGSGADQLFGEADNDTLFGKGGADLLFGGDGNDVLTGGDGDDQMFGGIGNDRFVWNPGDDTDLAEGGDGIDTVEVNGGNGAEIFTITANGARVRFDRVDPAPFAIDIGTSENLVLNANGGDDSVSVSGNVAALIAVTVDGGAGNDTLLGGNGADLLFGGDGNDFVDGNQGNDIVQLGAGDDVFQWDPGDGSDTVEGQDGFDTMLFNGSNISENIGIFANGGRVSLTRDVANIVMDLNGIETIDVRALGGADTITVDNLAGTGVSHVAIELAASGGGGDGQADGVIVNGTTAANSVTVTDDGTGGVIVGGLNAIVGVTNPEAIDRLVVNGGIGNDILSAAGLNNAIQLTLDGGAGNDTITGGNGPDTLLGGDGNDTVTGGRGDDIALLGAGNDSFAWSPGDGNDVVEGQAGADLLDFRGANVSENIDISANGGRARFFRDVANITMDLNDVETIAFHALGGADTIHINDMSGTDVTQVTVDLAGMANGATADAQLDSVTAFGTAGNDTVTVQGSGFVTVAGLAAGVSLMRADATDQLIVSGGAGIDTLSATVLLAGKIQLTLDGGAGNDLLTGSLGGDILSGGDDDDLLTGGRGADQQYGGLGNDHFILNANDGNDSIDGGDGIDIAEIVGTSGSETFTLVANGTAVQIARSDALASTMQISTTENITIDAGIGNDVVTAGNGIAALTSLTIDGGDGNDSITGGDGADQIFGGNGNDSVTGGRGNDLVLLGAGNDSFVWNPGDGSDTVEGGIGTDQLQFNGANISEHIDISANGGRARFFRDVANITMDLNDLETIAFRALGGADTITVGSMAGTDVKQIAIDLGTSGGGGDAQVDTVIVNGTASNDAVTLAGSGGAISVTGLAASVSITQSEAGDALAINSGAGNDTVTAAGLAAGSAQLGIDTGTGNDIVTGSQGGDQILSGDGVDTVTGGKGDDTILLGIGNDHVIWNAGDGSDTIEGQDGIDKLDLNGAAASDIFLVLANGGRITIATSGATLDIDHIEALVVHGAGGQDSIGIGDLTGTDLPQITVDLAAVAGGAAADGVADFVDFGGTTGNDIVKLSGSGGTVSTSGLSTRISVVHADGTDTIAVEAGAGNDSVTAALLAGVKVMLDGGSGDDSLIGSAGSDQLFGGDDNDIVTGGKGADSIALGAGDDRYQWAAGDGNDTVEGQAGADTLSVTGATTPDAMTLSANGGRALLTDTLAAAAIDMDDVETVSIVTQAGADAVVVNDLTGTDIAQVTINLAATPSGNTGDHSIDHITINATGGADLVELRAQAGGIVALGLNTPIAITRTDATDQILVNGGGGADLLFASDAPANSGKFFFDGGSGDDTIFGGLGDDSIVGGTGADRMDGGGGLDTLDYRLSAAGVTIDLGLGTGLGGEAAGDIVSGFERLLGSGFNDILTGSAAIDQLLGGNGVDSLLGQAGNDFLQGEAGNDRLTGGAGADQLTGGLGADRFVLLAASDSTGALRDKITDFRHAEGDRIDLSAIDANPAVGGNNGFTFIGTGAFDGGKGELNVVYGTGIAIVSGDIDGNKVADFSIIVTGVDAANPLVSTDFAL